VRTRLLEEFLTVAPPEGCCSRTQSVQIECNIQALVASGAELWPDFDPGGLSIPMVIVNY
jgi:hypothetical protein